MFKQVRSSWLKAIRSFQNSVNMGPTNFPTNFFNLAIPSVFFFIFVVSIQLPVKLNLTYEATTPTTELMTTI